MREGGILRGIGIVVVAKRVGGLLLGHLEAWLSMDSR